MVELLIVIAIIAVLAVVVTLTLNPAQLFAQARDARRVSDLAVMNAALNLYESDQGTAPGYSLGATSTTYVSIPSASASCGNLGFSSSSYAYACSSPLAYKGTSGAGWIPVDFKNIRAGSPIDSLSADPLNQTSSNLYYSYITNGSLFALTAFLESTKYASTVQANGGIDPALYEVGTGIANLPETGRGLVGYWPLNEGTGNTALDWSGYNSTGTWSGTPAGTSGYYSAGYPWQWAGAFNGTTTNDFVNGGNNPALGVTNSFTMAAWIYAPSSETYKGIMGDGNWYVSGVTFSLYNGYIHVEMSQAGSASLLTANTALPLNQWVHVAFVFNNGVGTFYMNGVPVGSGSAVAPVAGTSNFYIGTTAQGGWNPMVGLLDDARVYNRALSASEIAQLYAMK